MADPLIVDPALIGRVVSQFNLRGTLNPFILTNRVIPTFDIGQLQGNIVPTVVTTNAGTAGVRVGSVLGQFVPVTTPVVQPANVTDGGFQVNPGAAAVVVDTGAIAGVSNRTIDIYLNGSALFDVIVEHRNAANAANVAAWSLLVGGAGIGNMVHFGPHNLAMVANERIRVVTGGAVVGTLSSAIQWTLSPASSAT